MSSGHNAVMTNQGDWKSYSWNAVGVAVYKNSAAIWFGREADPTGGPAIDGFDPLRYLAGNADLAQAFGTDTAAAQSHYIQFGAREGRSTTAFNPHQYLAGYGDLMAAFGSDAQARWRWPCRDARRRRARVARWLRTLPMRAPSASTWASRSFSSAIFFSISAYRAIEARMSATDTG